MKKILSFALCMLFAGCFISCSEDEENIQTVALRTAVVTGITDDQAQLTGLVEEGLENVTELGVCYGLQPEEEMTFVAASQKTNEFMVTLNNLRSGTTYFARAYAKIGNQVFLGDLRQFTCTGQKALELPFVERFRGEKFLPEFWTMIDQDGDGYNWELWDSRFIAASSDSYRSKKALHPENYMVSPKIHITGSNPKMHWNVGVGDDGAPEEHYKLVISENPITAENCQNATVLFDEVMTEDAYRTLLYRSVELKGYEDKDIYFAFVHYDCTDQYFLYLTDIVIESDAHSANLSAPVVTLSAPTDVTKSSVSLAAEVTDDGGLNVIAKGFCLSENPEPTVDDMNVSILPHNELAKVVSELESGKTYYVRAYAKNAMGITYSSQATFATPAVITTTLLDEPLTGEVPSTWTLIDKDGDGHNWEYYDGYGTCSSDSYLSAEGALTPENYLFTPALTIPAKADGAALTFEVAASAKNAYKEQYRIVVSEVPVTLDNCRNAVVVKDWTELTADHRQKTFQFVNVDLSAFVGKTIYVGFLHGNCVDMESILLKNVKIESYE